MLKPGKGRKTPDQPEGSLPLRPAFGTKGKPVLLYANYFELVANGKQRLFRYSIEIKQPKGESGNPSAGRSRRIVELLLEEHFHEHLNRVASDYRSTLVSRGSLEIREEGYPVRFRQPGEDEVPDGAKVYECILKETGTMSVSELTDYLSSTRVSPYGSKEEVIQCLNIVLGQYCKVHPDIASVGANKHYQVRGPGAPVANDLGAGLVGIRGFFISVRAATARLLLNVQVKNGAFYQEGPLEQLMHVYRAYTRNDVMLEKFLSKLRIKLTHIKRKNKAGHEIERIKGIQSLARPGQGRGEHKPRIAKYAADADHVMFYVDDSGGRKDDSSPQKAPKGKKGKKPQPAGPAPSGGGFITVREFFRTSECRSLYR